MKIVTRDPTGGGQSRLLVVSKDPVASLDELRKLKFRHYSKAGIRACSELGVSTQVIPSSELRLALQTGVVDGAMYGAPCILSQSLDEVTCRASFVGALTLSPRGISADAAKWANLPADLQQAMIDVGDEMFEESMARWREEEIYNAAAAELTESSYKILEPFPLEDRLQIQPAILKVWREDVEKISPQALEYYDRIVAALKATADLDRRRSAFGGGGAGSEVSGTRAAGRRPRLPRDGSIPPRRGRPRRTTGRLRPSATRWWPARAGAPRAAPRFPRRGPNICWRTPPEIPPDGR